jgi:RNA ligase (TIGR02306 family)
MRKMATVRRIDAINPIPDADAIEVATVGGWRVVVKKGEFKPGDLAVYCEIDSWIPIEVAPFLQKGDRGYEYEGVIGNRLRTVKLRGQLSQGLLLPLKQSEYDKNTALIDWFTVSHEGNDGCPACNEGDDVSELLNIRKWEAPVPAQLAGEVRGAFPGFIPKTDQERVQNLTAEYAEWQSQGAEWEVTEKLDGSSMTVYVMDEDEGVCSRNLNLRETEDNSLWKTARRNQLIEKIRSTARNLALQGELIGEGIQGNPYKIRAQEFYLFDIYDIDAGRYLRPIERQELAVELDIRQVPGLGIQQLDVTVEQLLKIAEGKSVLRAETEREGLVFKHAADETSFKAISNKFLLKGGN